MLETIRKSLKMNTEEGATAVEYGLMVALIAVVIIVAVVALGKNTCAAFDKTADEMATTGGVGTASGATC